MQYLQQWKDGGSQRFWAKAYKSSVHFQSILAVAFPVDALISIILYIVLAHGLNICYTAGFWFLLSLVWSLPPCFYILYLYLLKRRSNKGTVYDLDDEHVREDFERDSLLRNERGKGREIAINEDYDEREEEEGQEEIVHKPEGTVKRSFSLDFIADGYEEHKFVPTLWNGLGITACVFGLLASFMAIVCNFLVGDIPGAFASLLTFFTVGSCMYLILHRSVGVTESIALNEMDRTDARQQQTLRWMLLAWRFVCVIAGVVTVIITILAALQTFVYLFNTHHYPPPGKMYDIGGGRKMHLDCNGTGGPTVVFLHGWGGQAYDWALVRPSISNFAKSCTLDRTGYGWTDAPDCLLCPRTAKVQAQDLNSLFLASQIANESILFVAHAEAVLDLRVFINTYKNYKLCGIVCVDCVDTGILAKVGPHLKNPVPAYWDMWRNVLPTGLLGVVAATGKMQKFDMISLLPDDIHSIYIQNELKPAYPETVCMDQIYLPQAAQEAVDAGGFGALKMAAIIAGKGLNATGVASLSTNSSLIMVPKAPHDMAFHEVFANIIIDQVRGAISFSRYSGCAV